MRYATFSTSDDFRPRLGAVFEDGMADARQIQGGPSPSDVWTVADLIQSGPEGWQRTAEWMHSASSEKSFTPHYRLADVRWHAPIPRPRKNVVCLGLNY